MRRQIVPALVLAIVSYIPCAFSEALTEYPNVGDEGLTFSIQAKKGGSWAPMKSHRNSAARACIFGENPRCYLRKGAACEPYAMKIEGPGGVRELTCMASRTERGDADMKEVQRNFNRAQYEAKGSSDPMVER
ncbi:hypothetical protein HB13667_07675 [Pseudomonas putida]|uniref:Uncharacterized protein n=1 Tax=Pseudomonas putida TaxID=303 RepID=A0A0P7DC91_PSEPU|nr:hypothetical protein HB13667_07675 [Pseudomonas putida]MCS4063678.1 hypothetical protein [Pseudomonas putida]